ncbi:MAG: methyltransferase domain-containing protein [Chloroflexi bacterium]|nr:methyltransferase domain-containing protein [Chloroflexota bacterium]MYD15989.1 methyltransferase domain-containing protein [Chloroflexota bacterium]MYF80930.1 methyltransferase domain-containing protein [Chloroflexota bacterium]MYI05007.1 methyltransferase domain-containing protein [Chloroflexota bacterium]
MPRNCSGRSGTLGSAEKGETIVTASDGDTSVPDYTMGYSEDYTQFLSNERALYAIAFLEPQLSAGLRLLDLRSGPGHVTAALAQRVAPGETIGIDINPSQLEAAQALASGQAGANLSFELADAARLPFADGSFDVVSCCDLLAYQPQPAVVLAEAHRVLKPGGLIYCREMIIESSFVHPDTPELARGWEIFADLLEADDGHPQIGKQLIRHLADRGYRDLCLSLTFETYAENSSVERFHRLVANWFRSSEITVSVLQYQAGYAGELEQFDEALERWRRTPGAYAAIAFGQATARK